MLRRVTALYLRPLLSEYTYTVRRGLAKGLKRKGGLGFIPIALKTKEDKFLLRLQLNGQTVYDVGGWEGVFTLFFARAVGAQGKVVTFEPNPHNQAIILENIHLNHFAHVRLLPVALGAEMGRTTMVVSKIETGRGSLRDEIKSGIRTAKDATSIDVVVDTLDHQINVNQLPLPNFVKIDVEGFELSVLEGMKQTIDQCKPQLYIEVHKIKSDPCNAQRVIEWLLDNGYSITSIEQQRSVTLADAPGLAGDHIYCV